MANYNTVITNEGAALLASVIANQGTLTLTEMRFSTNDYSGSEATLTYGTFSGVFITAAAAGSVVDSTTIKAASQFDNSTLVGDNPLYSIGLVGTDGNTTALIAVSTTTAPDIIRPAVTGVSTYAFNMNLTVSSTNNITVTGTTAAVLYDIDVIDTLISTATDKPLSANKGRVLNEKVESLTNPNLLDNPWFTVNQRGASSYSTAGDYTADKWYMPFGGLTVGISSSGATLTATSDTVLDQKFETDELKGKTVTLSIKHFDGTIEQGTVQFPSTTGTNPVVITGGELQAGVDTYGNCYFRIYIATGNTITARVIKLEVGSISTLANDVAPDYALELAKCRASTADPSDTYANKGNLVNYADLTSLYLTGSTNTTGSTITVGTFFYLNGSYCRAIADIANGATFTLNTNFEVDTVGDELAGETGTFTLTYDSGTYTDGFTSQTNNYKRIGGLVMIRGELELTGTPDSSHSYVILSGLPFKAKRYSVPTVGSAFVPNNGKVATTRITAENTLQISFKLADGTFPAAGQLLDYTIIYEC